MAVIFKLLEREGVSVIDLCLVKFVMALAASSYILWSKKRLNPIKNLPTFKQTLTNGLLGAIGIAVYVQA